VQKAVDTNREFALTWADAVTSLSGLVREQADKVEHATRKQAGNVEHATREQADKVEHAAGKQVDKVEHAEKDQARRVRQASNGHSDERNERLIDVN